MADLNDFDRPILSDNYVDCLDTLRENIKRVKVISDNTAASLVNYVPMAGSEAISGNLGMTSATGLQFSMNVTGAAANLKRAWFNIASGGEIRIGGVDDAMTTWQRGMGIKTDGTLYNLKTGSPLVTAAEVAGAYLPLIGGTLTGNLTSRAAANIDHTLNVTNAPANYRTATFKLQSDGAMLLGRINDAGSAWNGGIYVTTDNVLREIATSGKIWHSANDGAGSGLDADLLGGYGWSWYNVGNTVVMRHASGRIEVGDISTSRVVGGTENCGTLNSPWGYALRFHWDGAKLFVSSNNGAWLGAWGSDMSHSYGDYGYVRFADGSMIQWCYCTSVGDSSGTANWPTAFGWCQGVVCSINANRVDGQNNTYASHVCWFNASQVSCGITDAGFSVGSQIIRIIGVGSA